MPLCTGFFFFLSFRMVSIQMVNIECLLKKDTGAEEDIPLSCFILYIWLILTNIYLDIIY